MGLELTTVAAGTDTAGALIVARGAIDLQHAPVLDRAFDALAREGVSQVAIDLSGVRYVSSSGIAVLVKAAQALEARGGGLALLGITDKVRVVIEMLGIEQVFSVVCNRRPLATAGA